MRRPLPLVLAGVVLSACGSPALEVDGGEVDPAQQAACAALVDALPDEVAGQPRREVSGSEYAAAWGDEAIVLRCGVGMPTGFDETSECHQAGDIGWYVPPGTAEDQSVDVEMTTVHRSPTVEVHVPASLRPPVAVMVDLSEAIEAHTTATGSCR